MDVSMHFYFVHTLFRLSETKCFEFQYLPMLSVFVIEPADHVILGKSVKSVGINTDTNFREFYEKSLNFSLNFDDTGLTRA